jgi:uncharacterized protein
MGKILLFALLALVVYLVLRSRTGEARRRDPGAAPAEDMVACARCGINVPRSEAIESRGLLFCSDEHRSLGPG